MDNLHYFGEWVEYRNEEEKIEAKQYLELWKKFFIRKIPTLEFVEETFIDRPKYECWGGAVRNSVKATLGLKICMKGEKSDNVLSLRDLPIN